MLLLDSHDAATLQGDSAPDPTAWHLHAELHRILPQARCIMHTHMRYTTALCCLQDFEFLMLDQNACRFHRRIAYDRAYAGMALDAHEGVRVAQLLGHSKSVLFMCNHGVIVVAPTVAQALDELCYLEKAAELQVTALSTGRPLAIVPDAVAELACNQWNNYPTRFSELHLQAVKGILDDERSDYAL
jgi:ribulose-5-phosphate 4-epimerase/fuculose-1-phosphate aldolase